MTEKTPKQLDRETVRLLCKVEKLRAELKQLEPKLSAMVTQYGKRRGYMLGYREWHLRNDLNRMENVA